MSRGPRRTEIRRSSGALIALVLVVVAVPSARVLEFEPQAAIVTRVVDGDSRIFGVYHLIQRAGAGAL